MLVSQLIARLQSLADAYGDLPVAYEYDGSIQEAAPEPFLVLANTPADPEYSFDTLTHPWICLHI